jgi:hypothetical protein
MWFKIRGCKDIYVYPTPIHINHIDVYEIHVFPILCFTCEIIHEREGQLKTLSQVTIKTFWVLMMILLAGFSWTNIDVIIFFYLQQEEEAIQSIIHKGNT